MNLHNNLMMSKIKFLYEIEKCAVFTHKTVSEAK